MKTEQMIEVMQAYINGEQGEVRHAARIQERRKRQRQWLDYSQRSAATTASVWR